MPAVGANISSMVVNQPTLQPSTGHKALDDLSPTSPLATVASAEFVSSEKTNEFERLPRTGNLTGSSTDLKVSTRLKTGLLKACPSVALGREFSSRNEPSLTIGNDVLLAPNTKLNDVKHEINNYLPRALQNIVHDLDGPNII